ncbi:hypothetical protein [Nereida sp. MMG025]|uniref:hypothetical protein n=1 Tax=Nereida sp. MMG025 TaxID=2909981 RepID=UPI001F16AB24|nr:hypothetical protein [Nereida sp. MMG025]MCF6444313.1 hypothetical protein [Nereida sp. MMG025]
MIAAALILNLVILLPVITSFFTGNADAAFGPDTDARRILVSIYIAIAACSAGLLVALFQGASWIIPAALSLFAVQITYKVLTIGLVGLASPVVMTNLIVVVVQLAVIFTVIARA